MTDWFSKYVQAFALGLQFVPVFCTIVWLPHTIPITKFIHTQRLLHAKGTLPTVDIARPPSDLYLHRPLESPLTSIATTTSTATTTTLTAATLLLLVVPL